MAKKYLPGHINIQTKSAGLSWVVVHVYKIKSIATNINKYATLQGSCTSFSTHVRKEGTQTEGVRGQGAENIWTEER
jgi:3-methyladenine DNA glycosylase Tag